MDASLPKLFLVRHGETAWSHGGKHTGLTDIALTEHGESEARALQADALVFAHRDILRVVIARWIALPAVDGCRMHLATASVSTLGYDHDLTEPMILKLNETHDTRSS